jgi:ATP-dependent DNA helicase RecG
LAAEFQKAADYERAKGYNNVKGKRLFGAFLCDLLERAEAAQGALGLHAETLRWATQHARDYDKLLVPQRTTLLVRRLRARARCVAFRRLTCHPRPPAQVTCGRLLGAPHEPPVPLPDVAMPSVGPAPAAAAPAGSPVAPPLAQRSPVLLGSAAKQRAAAAATAATQGTAASNQQGVRVPPPPPRSWKRPLSQNKGVLPPGVAAQQPAVQTSPAPIVIAFDLETTGFNASNERIIEVAIIDCETGEAFSTLVNPGHTRIPAKITELTTITNGMVTQATVPGFALAAERMELRIAAWASRRRDATILLAAHNARSFDVRFLAAEYARVGRALPESWRFVDTLPLAQVLLKSLPNHKLASLHAHFKFADIGAHRAECDARMVQNLLGVQALGNPALEPDLHARLLREAFTAPKLSVIAARPAAPLAPPVAVAEAQALIEELDAADDWPADFSDGDDDDAAGSDSQAPPPWQAAVPRRPAAKKRGVMLPRKRSAPKADPLSNMQAQFEGVRLSGDTPAQGEDWQDVPLPQCLDAADAQALGPSFASVEQLLRHYPTCYDELQPFRRGITEAAFCVATGVVTSAPLNAPKQQMGFVFELSTQHEGVCLVQLSPEAAQESRALLAALQPGSNVTVRGRLTNGVLVAWSAGVADADAATQQAAHAHAVAPSWPPLPHELQGSLPAASWRRELDAALAKAEEVERIRGDWLERVLGSAELARLALGSGAQALRALHQPDSFEQVRHARKRVAFEELFLLQVSLLRRRAAMLGSSTAVHCTSTAAVDSVLAALSRRGWQLTPSQCRALDDVLADMASPMPMLRLLSGDFGCGKSVVAMLALLAAHDAGLQGALVVPTDALAQQHLARFKQLLEDAQVAPTRRPSLRVLCGDGATDAAERQSCLDSLAETDPEHRTDILIATHAEFAAASAKVARLGLVVLDGELQHAGALQRDALLRAPAREDGAPHVLTLSATPVPRTLALAAFGDHAVSVIDAKPPGCGAVVATMARPCTGTARAETMDAVRAEVASGGRACIVSPSDEAEAGLAVSATPHAELFSADGALAGMRAAVLHGQQTAEERAVAVSDFESGAASVLAASTPADAVAVVADVTLLVVERAERFSLTELHQLRDCVGRGTRPARCVLLYAEGAGSATDEGGSAGALAARMALLAEQADGLRLAEEDLRHRGPEALLGEAHRGRIACLALASLADDADLLDKAREAAAELLMRSATEGADAALSGALLYALHSRGVDV